MSEPPDIPPPSSADARTAVGPADTSLLRLLRDLEEEGYTGQFQVTEGPAVVCRTCQKSSPAADVDPHGTRRLEGASDPDDMLAVVLVNCPHCGTAGVVVANYGPESPLEHAEFLRDVS